MGDLVMSKIRNCLFTWKKATWVINHEKFTCHLINIKEKNILLGVRTPSGNNGGLLKEYTDSLRSVITQRFSTGLSRGWVEMTFKAGFEWVLLLVLFICTFTRTERGTSPISKAYILATKIQKLSSRIGTSSFGEASDASETPASGKVLSGETGSLRLQFNMRISEQMAKMLILLSEF